MINLDDKFKQPEGFAFGSFANADGKKIRYGHVAADGAAKGTVVMTTGYADFIESYFETIADWKKRGFDVYIMDWIEQGGSERNAKQGPAENARDLHQFRQEIIGFKKNGPVILSTHSIGSHFGLLCLKDHPGDFACAVMAAPLVDFQMSQRKRRMINLVLDFSRAAGLGNLKIKTGRKMVTKRIARERKKGREKSARLDGPRLHIEFNSALRVGNPTFHQLGMFFESTAKINGADFLQAIKIPVLMGLAGSDTVADLGAIARSAAFIPLARAVVLEMSSHNVWLEQDSVRERWWESIDIFIKDFCQRPVNFAVPPPPPLI